MLAETYASWLHSISQCCLPLSPQRDEKHRLSDAGSWTYERDTVRLRLSGGTWRRTLTSNDSESPDDDGVHRDQPRREPPPSVGHPRPTGTDHEDAQAQKRTKSWDSRFSVRRRFMSSISSSSRRPQISAPTHFRHIYSESFRFPSPDQRQRPVSFRPVELSIYAPNHRLSPLLPDFDIDEHLPPPPAAYTRRDTSWDDSSATLTHERSSSSMSFHLPRRQTHEASSFTESPEDTPPRVPPRSRARAYTSPNLERIVERIASAMIEKERLQWEIDSVIERQSIYTNSRPTTAYGMQDLEPMPSIPAVPAVAPSFAERLSTESRPQTAPTQPIQILKRQTPFAEASARFNNSSPRQERDGLDRPLAPPLPLVLRPPLRKKKSFSRVSSWLFPGAEQIQRDMGLDSVTNLPKPINEGEGFYQTMAPAGRNSLDTVTTASSSWETEEEGQSQTVPTTWSPGSSPMVTQDLTPIKTQAPPMMSRTAASSGRGDLRRPQSVGVAF